MNLPTVRGGWRCILADPPWSFRDKGSRIAPDQAKKLAAGRGYSTMRLAGISALPVGTVSHRDALLFLWSTSAHILDGSATAVCRAWGFEPKTTVVWVKVPSPGGRFVSTVLRWTGECFMPALQIGMGHYTRAAHELLVIARRGRPQILRHDLASVVFAPRRAHSAKPPAAYTLIEQLCPGPRLELFATAWREGWEAWGHGVR